MSAVASTSGTMRIDRGIAVVSAVVLLAAVVVAVFHHSYGAIWELWKLSTYQYALVLVPAAGYFLWQRHHALGCVVVAPSWPAMLLLLMLAMMWQVGRATAVQAVEHTAAIVAIPAIVLAVMGRDVFRTAAFPFLLLATTIPVGEAVTPLLMVVTADIASALLHLFGIPFVRHGQYMSLAGGDFKVADICAGTRYLLAGATLALIFGHWTFRTRRARALFMLATAAIFVVGNGVRAFIVMSVASATRMRVLGGHDHVIFGMIFFVVLLLAIFYVASRVGRHHAAGSAGDALEQARSLELFRPFSASGSARLGVAVIVATAALMCGPAVDAYRSGMAIASERNLQLPVLMGCSSPGEWRAGWTPEIHGEGLQQQGSYRCGAIDVHVLLVAYVNQTAGSELVGGGNAIVPREWWEGGASIQTEMSEAGHGVREILSVSPSSSMLAWLWYDVNGRTTTSEYGVKLREALAALTFQPVESRAYVISVVGPAARVEEIRDRVQQAASALAAPDDEAQRGS